MTDHFQVGQTITGLAGARDAAGGMLVVSTPKGLRAWSVDHPATASTE